MKKYLFSLFIISIASFLLFSCRGTTNSTIPVESTDITDAHFTRTQSGCENYVGNYSSNVTDVNNGNAHQGVLAISANTDNCSISSNEIPNHDFNNGNTSFINSVSAQSGNYTINKNISAPLAATLLASTASLSLQTTNGIFLNGVSLDLLAAACYAVGSESLGNEKIGCHDSQINNPWRYDPMSSLNDFGTDTHNAHTQPDGTYHYHGNPNAMFKQNCNLVAEVSPVIGFAADGYPIYGPCYQDMATGNVIKATSSYRLINNGGARQAVSGYQTPVSGQGNVASPNYDGQFIGDWEYVEGFGVLDECNGMIINNQYRYFITDSYPWVLACYKGAVDPSFSKSAQQLSNTLHPHF